MNNVKYYIGSGEENKMYTLRCTFPESVATDHGNYTVVRDYYCRNLATDRDRAIQNAKMYLGNRENLLSTHYLPNLDEIRRRENAIKEVNLKIEREEWENRQELLKNAREERHVSSIKGGCWPFGSYYGQIFSYAPKSYILYWIQLEQVDGAAKFLQEMLAKQWPELVNLPSSNGKYYGEIKKREIFDVTLIADFGYEGYYGYVHVAKFIKDSGELIVYQGASNVSYCDFEIGDRFKIKGTIKSHEIYEGENQTKVQRLLKVA